MPAQPSLFPAYRPILPRAAGGSCFSFLRPRRLVQLIRPWNLALTILPARRYFNAGAPPPPAGSSASSNDSKLDKMFDDLRSRSSPVSNHFPCAVLTRR